ncbi:hypothetical protein BCR32DRAFT_243685 [Anaeromyces robustus]|uniref:Uncharacterized protein n=1 Tax=Anaeromyces robustus TaxID=1754192 RepID=A0A1Y1XBF6_9FUNG|nr:hypothetical protein BCR32DRAFT_243685 [Anaeromyces robustus]|eukprot:ORX83063.1 hypothetical protein BCR32DRAFT_243685 [Anaeromyces robustus]
MVLISFGLFYNNASIISLNGILNFSIILTNINKILSFGRYILHGILLLLLFLICKKIISSSSSKIYHYYSILITTTYTIIDIIQRLYTVLEIVKTSVIYRYTSSNKTSPQIFKNQVKYYINKVKQNTFVAYILIYVNP